MELGLISLLSLIFGVVGMCLSCIVIGIIPCAISLILAVIALRNDIYAKWPSICGIICSAVGIAMFAVVISQTDEYRKANVSTPTDVVENMTNHNEINIDNDRENTRFISENTEAKPSVFQNDKDISDKTEDKSNDKIIDADFDNFTIKYISHEVSTDYDGNPCVIIYYDFTNKKDEPTSASMSIYSQVFQNGVQCDLAFITGNEYISNASKDVQKGITIRVGSAYVIKDMSDIDVVIKEAFSFSNKSDEMILKLRQ